MFSVFVQSSSNTILRSPPTLPPSFEIMCLQPRVTAHGPTTTSKTILDLLQTIAGDGCPPTPRHKTFCGKSFCTERDAHVLIARLVEVALTIDAPDLREQSLATLPWLFLEWIEVFGENSSVYMTVETIEGGLHLLMAPDVYAELCVLNPDTPALLQRLINTLIYLGVLCVAPTPTGSFFGSRAALSSSTDAPPPPFILTEFVATLDAVWALSLTHHPDLGSTPVVQVVNFLSRLPYELVMVILTFIVDDPLAIFPSPSAVSSVSRRFLFIPSSQSDLPIYMPATILWFLDSP